eukprot:c14773_g1_i1.p2 GENE.c14773_g1_i1~~c14773_g1_i1.p2  ORF type:complete len:138 (+),score=10.85 c14773_g1_i1:82-495(+)
MFVAVPTPVDAASPYRLAHVHFPSSLAPAGSSSSPILKSSDDSDVRCISEHWPGRTILIARCTCHVGSKHLEFDMTRTSQHGAALGFEERQRVQRSRPSRPHHSRPYLRKHGTGDILLFVVVPICWVSLHSQAVNFV